MLSHFYLDGGGDYERTHNDNGRSGSESRARAGERGQSGESDGGKERGAGGQMRYIKSLEILQRKVTCSQLGLGL